MDFYFESGHVMRQNGCEIPVLHLNLQFTRVYVLQQEGTKILCDGNLLMLMRAGVCLVISRFQLPCQECQLESPAPLPAEKAVHWEEETRHGRPPPGPVPLSPHLLCFPDQL